MKHVGISEAIYQQYYKILSHNTLVLLNIQRHKEMALHLSFKARHCVRHKRNALKLQKILQQAKLSHTETHFFIKEFLYYILITASPY